MGPCGATRPPTRVPSGAPECDRYRFLRLASVSDIPSSLPLPALRGREGAGGVLPIRAVALVPGTTGGTR